MKSQGHNENAFKHIFQNKPKVGSSCCTVQVLLTSYLNFPYQAQGTFLCKDCYANLSDAHNRLLNGQQNFMEGEQLLKVLEVEGAKCCVAKRLREHTPSCTLMRETKRVFRQVTPKSKTKVNILQLHTDCSMGDVSFVTNCDYFTMSRQEMNQGHLQESHST